MADIKAEISFQSTYQCCFKKVTSGTCLVEMLTGKRKESINNTKHKTSIFKGKGSKSLRHCSVGVFVSMFVCVYTCTHVCELFAVWFHSILNYTLHFVHEIWSVSQVGTVSTTKECLAMCEGSWLSSMTGRSYWHLAGMG